MEGFPGGIRFENYHLVLPFLLKELEACLRLDRRYVLGPCLSSLGDGPYQGKKSLLKRAFPLAAIPALGILGRQRLLEGHLRGSEAAYLDRRGTRRAAKHSVSRCVRRNGQIVEARARAVELTVLPCQDTQT